MAKQIAKLLKADLQDSSDLRSIAKMLSGKGRGGDTLLAHITPKEARILKEAGGSGTVNPDTGLLEFYEDSGEGFGDYTPQQSAMNLASERQDALNYGFGSEPTYEWQAGDVPQVYNQATGATDFAPSFAVPPAAVPEAPVAQAAPTSGTFAGVPAAASQEYAPVPAAAGAPAAAEKSFLQQYVGDPLKALKETTGLSSADLLRLGGSAAGALAGRSQSQQAAKQIQQAVQEQKDVGKPYQTTGQEMQRAAMAGELTPQSMQSYKALQAQLAQGAAARGGVGVAQSQAQLEAMRQNLLQNQYNYGLQVAQIGDNIALGAIKTGMQLDAQLAQVNQQFYTQLAAIAGGGTYGYQQAKPAGTQ